MKDSIPCYSVGALLYCPAINKSFVTSLQNESFGKFFSLALCLEDTIRDDLVQEAEQILVNSLQQLHKACQASSFYMPKIFIRPRKKEQLATLINRLGDACNLVTGFILPKFSTATADGWLQALNDVNKNRSTPFYIMPILESPELLHLTARHNELYSLKKSLDDQGQTVLNIRVGANDLCHGFGLRRANNQSIYDVRPVANILTDILTVFSTDYVVSGAVWEYYKGNGWDIGLLNELALDKLNGFVGKTVIHPNQIPLVNLAYQVTNADYADALAILGWDDKIDGLVAGSATGERMNEHNTHFNWAKKIHNLAQTFGITPPAAAH